MAINEWAIPSGNPKNLTASAVVKQTSGALEGFFVNSTSTGTIKFYDGQDNTGTVITGTITPSAGWNHLPTNFKNGLYAEIGSTLNVTIIYV